MKTYFVTGGAGFIGSNYVKYILKKEKELSLVILDKLTYAGSLENIEEELKDERVSFIEGDICDQELVEEIFSQHDIDYVINFAAESHVDRSIENPRLFLETNILGTQCLLDVAKKFWSIGKDEKGYPVYQEGKKFLQVSTDEVYGSLERDFPEGRELFFEDKDREVKCFGENFFTEDTPLAPKSPYSASKAAADMLVLSYKETYHMPVNITRCSNNYGPQQFPEKLIPLMIQKALAGETLPVYGDGGNVRDWLYVEDHCKGIETVLQKGRLGEVYNIGGFNEETNLNIVKSILDTIADGNYDLISYVQDRLGHDERYAIDPSKIMKELGWYPETAFSKGIQKTISWYLKKYTK